MTAAKILRRSDIGCWLKDAVSYQRAGDLNAAERRYEEILGCDPHNADALHLQGLIDFERGDPERAILKIQLAIDSDPTFADFYRSLGRVKKSIGALEEALDAYQRAVSINSTDLLSLAASGTIHFELGRLNAAESCFRACIQLNPDLADPYANLGLVYRAKKRYGTAISCFKRALAIDERLSSARCNLAITLKDLGQLDAALAELQQTIEIEPGYPAAYYHLGLVRSEMGHLSEAIASYAKAIALNPNFGQPHNNMGILLQELGRTREAINCFQNAIDLDPNNAKAHYNLGMLQKYHGRCFEAVECLKRALAINPEFSLAKFALMTHLRDICDWSKEMPVLDRSGASSKKNDIGTDLLALMEPMFAELSQDYLGRVLAAARDRSDQIEQRARFVSAPFRHDPRQFTKNKITVGYISNNFRDHPTAHLICDLFACHDRDRFDIVCYSYGDDDRSEYRKLIRSGCDRFIDLYNSSSRDAAALLHGENTQILVDLNGHTACSRLDICSFRPAPVQVRYLGEAKTSGSSFFDYLIGDPIVTPLSQEAYYTEKLALMPHSYQINSRPIDHERSAEIDRQTCQLPEHGFVFCSFATSYKIDPVLFESWMHILDRVSGSVLWLLKRDRATESNLITAAGRLGIDRDRLIFTRPLAKSAHLARIGLANLCLDTRVVNGAATTSDALWAGVPVITIRGRHFASRMSASILTAVGLPELITSDLRAYEDLAVALATDSAKLDRIRGKLEENKHSQPLFDTRRFVRNLENAFEQMWAIYMAGEQPRHITVQDCG